MPPQLNLPDFSPRISGNTIFDPLRRKFVALTPEEWVRQAFTAYLVNYLDYPASLMANEVSLRLNSTLRRCDTVIYSRRGMHPLAVVEYKAPHVAITGKVFDQIARYNIVVGAPVFIVSNGMVHYCCRFNPSSQGGYAFLREIPAYEQLMAIFQGR